MPGSLIAAGGTQYLLFEGAGVGAGQLVLTVLENGNPVASTSADLDLRDIKDLYQRAVITETNTGAISNWNSGFIVDKLLYPNPTQDSNLIVFVHGINVGNWDWYSEGATVFKRLYWAGYQGQFATVKWPCEFFDWTLVNNGTSVFNKSEAEAYKASAGLAAYVNGLHDFFSGYRLHLLVHSQGNAVVSEAIEQHGLAFDTYIITQGALPGSAYDTNTPTDPGLAGQEITNCPTPLSQPMGYRGAYTNLPGQIVNFYNTNDPVLKLWMFDQGAGKPDGYLVHFLETPVSYYSSDGTNGWYNAALGFRSYMVTDPEESRAFVSRSRTLPIGQSGTETGHGVVQSGVDMHARYGFNDVFPDDHSAQWTWPIQTTRAYYIQVIDSMNP